MLALARLMEAYGVKRLDELATAMDLPYGTVRNWHTRESVPERYLLRAASEKNRPKEWFTAPSHEALSFAPTHIQVNKNVTGDAFAPYAVPAEPAAKGGPGAPSLLSLVVARVVAGLQARGLQLPPDKLGELVSLIYEHVQREEPGETQASDNIEATTQRYLRLVA